MVNLAEPIRLRGTVWFAPAPAGRAAAIRTLAGGDTREVRRRRLAAGSEALRSWGGIIDPVAAFPANRGGLGRGACASGRAEDPSWERGRRAAGGDSFFDRPPTAVRHHYHRHQHLRKLVMDKQHGSAGLGRRPVDACFHEFRLDYEQTKDLAPGHPIYSDPFSAGGHKWRIICFPRGNAVSHNGKYLSMFVELVSKGSKPNGVSAIFEAFLMDKDGEPSSTVAKRTRVHQFEQYDDWGWSHLVSQTNLVDYVTEGHIRIICGIMVVNDSSIPVPPSDIVEHLGTLLDSTDGADVSFVINSETFHAHRALLAARSPVFKAELLGSMVEATMPSITLHDIAPATFKLLLRFMYTDTFPDDDELGDDPSGMIHRLLAAADRYALDRLKLMCAQKLWDNVSVDTVATTLACAEMYSCQELKIKCIDFFAMEKNFRKAVLTDGFVQLVQQFPSIVAELRERSAT
ncbi:unnamed protein product [Urochloa humidicola]